MLYFSRFSAFDPYLAFSLNGKKIGIAHSMEFGRMTEESDCDEVLLLSEVQESRSARSHPGQSLVRKEVSGF